MEIEKNLRGMKHLALQIARIAIRSKMPSIMVASCGTIHVHSESEIDFTLSTGGGLWVDEGLLRISDGVSIIEFGAVSADGQPWQILSEKPNPWLDTTRIANLLQEAQALVIRAH